MHPPISREAVDTNPDCPHSLADHYPANPAVVDEMITADGCLRPHWKQFVSMLDGLGTEELQRSREHARRLMRENGVTHTVYGDPAGWNQPWNLDLIPLLIPADQWARLREGLIQRARLLDRLLADLYGPMRTVLDGLLPPELLWANRSFATAPSCRAIAGCISMPPISCAPPRAATKCSTTARRRPPARDTL
jgi:uncharacterized circularly permuted ATP-grasp superfamily protein